MTPLIINDGKELLKRLKAFGQSLVIVALLSDAGSVVWELKNSAQNIYQANKAYQTELPLLREGKYRLQAIEKTCSEKTQNLNYDNSALAITFDAKISKSHSSINIGDLPALRESLKEFSSISRIGSADESKGLIHKLIGNVLFEEKDLLASTDYPLGYIWVSIPKNPIEEKRLISALQENSVFFATPNGQGTLDNHNFHQGNGLSKIYG
jgi:hypothetical protein